MRDEEGEDARFHGWLRPGPRPPGGIAPEPGETLDYHCGYFKIFQEVKGHRYSTDDLLTAFYGTLWAPRAERILDLGSGIGSVALAAAWRLPGATLVTLEAQERSVRLARKTVRYNGLENRYRILHGDLRDASLLADEPGFDLVLGSPPYFPAGTAIPAVHPQAVPARIEMRGDVRDYAKAAVRSLAPGGFFAFVFPARDPRVDEGCREAGLTLVRRRDIVFREDEPPVIALFAAVLTSDLPKDFDGNPELPVRESPLVIRRRDGRRSAEYAVTLLTMGFPPGPLLV